MALYAWRKLENDGHEPPVANKKTGGAQKYIILLLQSLCMMIAVMPVRR